MDDPRQPLQIVPQRPSLLARAAVYTLVPILVVVALPLLLLIILAIYLLALVQGGRVFFFRWSSTAEPTDISRDLPKPHAIEIDEPKADRPA